MSEKKVRVTKSQRFEDIIALLKNKPVKYGTDTTIAVDVLLHELDLLAKKNSSDSKKPTPTQKENEVYKGLLAKFLEDKPDGATCTDCLKGIPELSEYSNQKVSALLRQMKQAGQVTSTEVKGRAYFRLA